MPRYQRPTIKRHQTANDAPANEARFEFDSPNGGGLLTLATTEDGRLFVDVFRCDETVTVRSSAHTISTGPQPSGEPLRITDRAHLIKIARQFGVRDNWHEPDEQDVTAIVAGTAFDNAGHWPNPGYGIRTELHVILMQGDAHYAVNLATLLAWATGYKGSE